MSRGLSSIDTSQPEHAGFARQCLIAGAITLAEYQDWITHLIAQDVDLPDYYFDLLDLTDRTDAIAMRDRSGNPIDARRPTANLSRREGHAISGIARLRFPDANHGIESPARISLKALADCPHIVAQFREAFPFLPLFNAP